MTIAASARSARSLWCLGLLTLALVVPIACSTAPEPSGRVLSIPPPPFTEPALSASSTASPTVASSVEPTAAPTVAATDQPAAPPAPSAAPTVSPLRRPDPGPGVFSCGDAVCKAGTEVCAPKTACGEDWPAKGCVTVAELAGRRFGLDDPAATCKSACHSWFDKKSCDGPSDCQSGEVCCHDSDLIIGPCDDGEDGVLEEYACKQVVHGRTPCGTAEVCSAIDRKCRRKGSTCVVDDATGLGTCQVPRPPPPKCGAARCAKGQVCIETWADGTRRCVADPAPHMGKAGVIECDGGRDCAPDEACFAGMGGHRCDLSAISWAGNDLPICRDDRDCVGLCGAATATCHSDGPRKFCECRPRCTRDADCRKDDYCIPLSYNRFGGGFIKLEPFCRTAARRCDCREPGH